MAIVNVSQDVSTQVVIRFTLQDGDLVYSDSLYFTPSDFAALTQKDISNLEIARFVAWKAILTAPRQPLTPQEKLIIYSFLLDQRAALDQAIADASS